MSKTKAKLLEEIMTKEVTFNHLNWATVSNAGDRNSL